MKFQIIKEAALDEFKISKASLGQSFCEIIWFAFFISGLKKCEL